MNSKIMGIIDIADRILFLCDSIPPKLKQIPEKEFRYKPFPNKWSKKEILGHLIDSATNNHHRFIRSQFENSPEIFYDQNQWVQLQQYNLENSDNLVRLWQSYNRHIAHVIAVMPPENFSKTFTGMDGSSNTLAFLTNDYLEHLEYHLRQITEIEAP